MLAIKRSLRALALAGGISAAISGCTRDPCEKMWKQATQCKNLPDDGLDAMIESCRTDDVRREAARRTLECGHSCEKIDTCFAEATREVQIEMLDTRLEPLAKTGSWTELASMCKSLRARASESERAKVDQTCTPYLRQAYDTLSVQLGAGRDGGLGHDSALYIRYERTYLEVAEQLGPSEHDAAKALVDHLRATQSSE